MAKYIRDALAKSFTVEQVRGSMIASSPWRIRNLEPVPAVRPVSSIAQEQQSQRLQVRR
jgi:hypothetical protein